MGKNISTLSIIERTFGLLIILSAIAIAINVFPLKKDLTINRGVLGLVFIGLCLSYRSHVYKFISRLQIHKATLGGIQLEIDAVQSVFNGIEFGNSNDQAKWLRVLFTKILSEIDETLIAFELPVESDGPQNTYLKARSAVMTLAKTNVLRSEILLSYLALKKIDTLMKDKPKEIDETTLLKSLGLSVSLHRELIKVKKLREEFNQQ